MGGAVGKPTASRGASARSDYCATSWSHESDFHLLLRLVCPAVDAQGEESAEDHCYESAHGSTGKNRRHPVWLLAGSGVPAKLRPVATGFFPRKYGRSDNPLFSRSAVAPPFGSALAQPSPCAERR